MDFLFLFFASLIHSKQVKMAKPSIFICASCKRKSYGEVKIHKTRRILLLTKLHLVGVFYTNPKSMQKFAKSRHENLLLYFCKNQNS